MTNLYPIPLYPILDTAALRKRKCSLIDACAAMVETGARMIQIRHKDHWSREVFTEAAATAEICAKHSAQLIVNDRADFAMLLGAGLHLGQEDLSPRDARELIGRERILGFSTHNATQLEAAAAEPADYVALGPIFATGNKPNPDPQVGLENLAAWRQLTPRPLVAIGGITRANAREALQAGADAVAVIGDLLPDPCNDYSLRERYEEWQLLLSR